MKSRALLSVAALPWLMLSGCSASGLPVVQDGDLAKTSTTRTLAAKPFVIRDATGTWTYYTFAPTLTPFAIALGPDGNLWTTTLPGIARITPSGVVTSFDTPNSPLDPGKIVAGADGNMWFIWGPGLGKITMNGVVTEYENPHMDAFDGIAEGSGGVIWFTDENPRTATIAEDGTITTIGPSIGPWLITGADGAIWGCYWGDHFLSRISPAGQVTHYQVNDPSEDIGVSGMVEGLDGNVWIYVQPGINEPGDFLGRMDLQGNLTQYPGVGRITDWSEFFGVRMAYASNGILYFSRGPRVFRFDTKRKTYRTALRLPLGPAGLRPSVVDMTAGPNESIWFTVCTQCLTGHPASYVGEFVPN